MNVRHAPPRAASMIESLRGLGYSVPTALADIIDNSLSADATTVHLQFKWDGTASTVTILDNGIGMDDPELESAMRLGAKNPLDVREARDLGRFGLGLKTASFSQCRRLTVASRKSGQTSCLRWDLDKIAETTDGDGWSLIEGPAPESAHLLACLETSVSGTLVVWEHLDRIVTPGFKEQEFLDVIDGVERHLAMVFHRYLSGSPPALRLTINRREVEPWDPFLSDHPATWTSPLARIQSSCGAVGVRCHVLPHRDKLDPRRYADGGGPHGWTAQQGFYVYRNERLLLAGSWLGLGRGRSWTKEESHRLARIRLDITNASDTGWTIDIRKSVARPPVDLRERLMRLAEDTRDRARRVFAHRGQVIRRADGSSVVQAWRAEHHTDGMRYRIENDHPAVRAVLEEAGALEPQIRAMLSVIEQTIPVQRIWLDTAEAKETPRAPSSTSAPAELIAVLSAMYKNLVRRKGVEPAAAREQLLRTDPFDKFPHVVAALPDEPA